MAKLPCCECFFISKALNKLAGKVRYLYWFRTGGREDYRISQKDKMPPQASGEIREAEI